MSTTGYVDPGPLVAEEEEEEGGKQEVGEEEEMYEHKLCTR